MQSHRFFAIQVLGITFLALYPATALSANLRGGFPQVVVGDQYVTLLDFTNKGVQWFYGDLAIRDDEGTFLPVDINGERVFGNYALLIPPGNSIRLKVTQSGPTVVGHAMVWDREPAGKADFDPQIEGTAIFQFKDGNRMLDSVGLIDSETLEHFYFLAEYSNEVFTGLALSEQFGNPVSIAIRAFSDNGALVDEKTWTLVKYGHQSFFIHERLSLPKGFRGTIEVQASKPIRATALRMEGTQFSTIAVSPFQAIFDLEIQLSNGRKFEAESTFSISDGTVRGFFRYLNPSADSGLENLIITGGGGEGNFLANTHASFGGRAVILTLLSPSVRTDADTISGTVIWNEEFSLTVRGTFSGKRRK